MRKVAPIVVLFLSSGAAVAAQQHPTVSKEAKCRADADAWGTNKAEISKLPMRELAARHDSMMGCEKADPGWKCAYIAVENIYNAEMLERVGDFLKRHDLGMQMVSEDAARQR